ncbi:MAG: DivIVA domain-containing protein [Clostridia bacterium]|nr:DivIVA domain-containing protein [Clostridia bacterium]
MLDQVVETIEELHKENAELVRKLEVLAERIQEYRNEEDSIRSALLTAQKSADKILKEANEEKQKILGDALQQADDSVRLSQEKAMTIANETREKVALVLNEAKEKATNLLNDAKVKSDNMLQEAVEGCKAEKQYLDFLKEQEAAFRQQLLEMYKAQFEMFKKGPEILKELEQKLSSKPEPITLEQQEALEETINVESQTEEAVIEADFVEPEDIPLPIASNSRADDSQPIENGFEIDTKFSDLKFGEDYDISEDEDYDDYGV